VYATRTSICFLLVCAVLFANPVLGQEPERRISMVEALRLFGENSLALRVALSEARQIEGEARQSRAYFNPALTVVREDLGRGSEDYWETTVGLEQRLEWPGRTAARRRAAGHLVGAAAAGYRADSLRLAFEVRSTYAEAWAAEERELALRRAADVMIRLATAAERRFEEGDISGYEARRLRLERVRIEQDAEVARLETAVARRTLASLVFSEGEITEVGPSEPLAGRPPAIAHEAALEALSQRPDLEAARSALEAARAQVSIANSAWVPDPTVALGYKDQADGFSGAALSVAIPIPLFDRKGGAGESARARAAGAAAGLDLRRREARNDVLAAADRYASLRARLGGLGEDLMDEADALLAAAGAAYDEGEMELVGLLDAARAFRDARLMGISLRANTWVAYYDLLRAMGRVPEEER